MRIFKKRYPCISVRRTNRTKNCHNMEAVGKKMKPFDIICLLVTQLSITIQHFRLNFSLSHVVSCWTFLFMYSFEWIGSCRLHHRYGSIIWSSQVATEWCVRTNLLWKCLIIEHYRCYRPGSGTSLENESAECTVYVTRQVWL